MPERDTIETPPYVHLPQPRLLELETVLLPRDAFFGRVEQIPVDQAEGRVAANMVSPYPPGVPVLAPGERILGAALAQGAPVEPHDRGVAEVGADAGGAAADDCGISTGATASSR